MNSDEYAYLHECGADYVTVFQEMCIRDSSYASSDKAALPQQEVLDSRAVLYSESDMSALMDCQYREEIPSFPAVICRIRTSSLGFLGRLTSNLSWLGALLQFCLLYTSCKISGFSSIGHGL